MSLRCVSLGSGSRGNATLVCSGRTVLLLDCGFGARELGRRLARRGMSLDAIDAILITHEHRDHVGGVGPVARACGAPVAMTAGTRRACGYDGETLAVTPQQRLRIGDIDVLPFPVPHDAAEPCQYVFECGGVRLGVLSDLGRATPCVVQALSGLDGLMLEANHDPAMLDAGPYPPALKRRVAGALGHLSNAQAGELLAQIISPRLRFVALTHLSETNNTPELARRSCAAASGWPRDAFIVADQANGSPWLNPSNPVPDPCPS